MKGFASFHPVVIFVYLLSTALFSMFINNPFFLLISLFMGMGFFAVITNVKQLFKALALVLSLIAIITVINPLISHRGNTVFLFINSNPITLEAVIYGIGMGLMLSAVIVWFNCFNNIVTSEKLLFVIGRIIPKLSLIISITLRFIPLFISKGKQIRTAQKAMGMYVCTGIIGRIKGEMCVASGLITWALENSIETSMSMQSRGYGLKNRTSYNPYKFRKRDAFLLVTNIVLGALIIYGQVENCTYFYYYPKVVYSEISSITLLCYIGYTMFMALPLLIEIKGEAKWNCCLSKI